MIYASATHPPASRDLEPYWQVGEWRKPLPPPTHLPVGKTPLVGVLPYYSVGRTQKPLSHKLTPSSLPPFSMFMTEVTSMPFGAIPRFWLQIQFSIVLSQGGSFVTPPFGITVTRVSIEVEGQ